MLFVHGRLWRGERVGESDVTIISNNKNYNKNVREEPETPPTSWKGPALNTVALRIDF